MIVYYKINSLYNRIGIITDEFDEYYEVQDQETGEYKIVLKEDVQIASQSINCN